MTGSNFKKVLIPMVAILAVGSVCAEEPLYAPERYDIIIERSPFGSDPLQEVDPNQKAADAAAAAAEAAAEKAAKELRLCFLLESENGEIRAGFQNLKAKPGDSKNITLMVGESFMGMKLLDVNIPDSQATLERKGESVVFELTKAPTPAKGKNARKTPAVKANEPKRQFGGGFRRREPPKQPPPAQPTTPKLSPEEQRIRREEIRANLQEYQMEVIRQGMPPLPVPLTPEMDAQLVEEGVLPPQEF